MSVDSYVIEPRVLASVRLHAGRAPSGDWEVGGRLLRERDRLVAYEPIENVSAAAGWYEPVEWPRDPWLLVHSHPSLTHHTVSDGDVQVMRNHNVRSLAVFTPLCDRLSVWVLDESRENGVREIPVVVEPRAKTRRPLVRRPGRRT